ncbi:hypothetical protein STEG23_023417 [Scotinomys teguina]
MSGSVVLLQPRSVLKSTAQVAMEGCVDAQARMSSTSKLLLRAMPASMALLQPGSAEEGVERLKELEDQYVCAPHACLLSKEAREDIEHHGTSEQMVVSPK